jgi:hypothetical protein
VIERDERHWVWWFSVILCVLTFIPYLMGYFLQGSDKVFSGFLFGVDDGNSYIAKMLLGANGAWLFQTPYTAYEQNGAFVYFPYLLLGKLTAPPGQHEQLVAIYHLFRAAATIFLVFTTYEFLALFIHSKALRRLGTGLILCGGGMGWLSLVGFNALWSGRMPVEYYSPEAFGFLMIFGLPHLACARALMLWGLRNYLDGGNLTAHWKSILKNGVIWTGVGLMQPMIIIVAWGAIGADLLVRGMINYWLRRMGKRIDGSGYLSSLRKAILVGFLSAPLVVYTFVAFRLDPYLRNWEKQNVLTSPPFTDYLLAYALILPFAILGIRLALRKQIKEGILLTGWLLIFPILIYLPLTIQRRLIEGAWIALVGLALVWMETQSKVSQKRLSGVFSLSFITSVLVIFGSTYILFQRYPPIYLPANEVKAFHFLAEHTQPRAVILAAEEVSNPLPAWAPLRTLAGHGPESVNAVEILEEEKVFFQPQTPDNKRKELITRFQVAYVFWGPQEKEYGSWNPSQAAYLRPVYQNKDYQVFKVALPEKGIP